MRQRPRDSVAAREQPAPDSVSEIEFAAARPLQLAFCRSRSFMARRPTSFSVPSA